MIGESKLKYTAFIFVLVFLIVFLVLFVSQVYKSSAQEMKVGPPGSENLKSLNQSVGQKSNSIFQKIKNIERGIRRFFSSFGKLSQKVVSWWSNQAKPWITSHWTGISTYLNQEISIK